MWQQRARTHIMNEIKVTRSYTRGLARHRDHSCAEQLAERSLFYSYIEVVKRQIFASKRTFSLSLCAVLSTITGVTWIGARADTVSHILESSRKVREFSLLYLLLFTSVRTWRCLPGFIHVGQHRALQLDSAVKRDILNFTILKSMWLLLCTLALHSQIFGT